jgi:proteic killer suppression protein
MWQGAIHESPLPNTHRKANSREWKFEPGPFWLAFGLFDLFTRVKNCFTVAAMIESFMHKGLEELFEKGKSAKVQASLADRALRRLDAIDTAKTLEALNIPGFDFHPLHGKPKRYSIHVNGPWCITFEWDGENALRVNLENYH